MNDFSKLSASVDRALAKMGDDETKLAAADLQPQIDELTAKIDAKVPPPAEPQANTDQAIDPATGQPFAPVA